MLRKTLILMLITLVFFNYGCSFKQEENNINKRDGNNNYLSFFTELDNEQGITENSSRNFIYYLKDDIFKGDLLIDATSPKPVTCQLIVLLDYKQIDSIPITLNPEKRNAVPFEVSVQKNGTHDLIFLLIELSNQHSLDKAFRFTTSELILGQRVNVVKGNNGNTPKISFLENDIEETSNRYPPLIINKSASDKDVYWFKEAIDPSVDKMKYYVHLSNKSNQENSYAFLAFLDNNQIPIDSELDVCYTSLNKNKMISVPATLTLPKEKGIHELFVISVPNPYIKLKENLTKPSPSDTFVISSSRVGLEIK